MSDLLFAEDDDFTPKSTLSVMGHDEIRTRLHQSLRSGTLPHTMIFHGPRGIGKSLFVNQFVCDLLLNGSDDTALKGRILAGAHPDLKIIGLPIDEKTQEPANSFDLDKLRQIPSFMRLSASEGGRRIAVIDDADRMNMTAQNALLKIMEEPPKNAHIIFISHRLGSMLPTIRSRAAVYAMQPLGPDDFYTVMCQQNIEASTANLDLLRMLCAGSPGCAIEMLENKALDYAQMLDEMLADGKVSWIRAHQLADQLSKPNTDKELQSFFNVIMWFICQNALAQSCGPLKNLENLRGICDQKAWIGLYDSARDDINALEYAYLDKRQIILKLFQRIEEIL